MAQRRSYFACAWGSVRLWLANISTDEGRSVAVQQYTRGNVPHLRDTGDVPKVVRCTLLFDDMTGSDKSPLELLEDLILLKGLGKEQLFTHPIFGTYRAMITDFVHDIDASGNITATASFIASEEVGEPTVDPIGVSLDVAADSIEARRLDLLSQLESVDLTSDVPTKASLASTVFAEAASARSVLVTLSNASDLMWQEIDEKQLAADVALYPLFKAYVMLGESLRAGADVAMGDRGNFMTVRVDSPTTLRRLMSDIYGAREANDRHSEAMELNDIRTPLSLVTGTQLRLRQPSRAA